MDKILRRLILIIVILMAFSSAGVITGSMSANAEEPVAEAMAAVVFTDPGISINLDGNILETDTPATIVQERTLVPARAIFEAMGGTADWNNDTRVVTIRLNGTEVQLTIDSKAALVNGTSQELEVPATIINERTMVPVRFIAEAAGSTVGWDNDSRTVMITSPVSNGKYANITSIILKDSDEAYVVEVNSDKVISEYDDFTLDSPERFVLDVQNAALRDMDSPLAIDNETIKSVRYSQYDAEAVRVVVDLKDSTRGKISRSADNKTIYIAFDKDDENIGDSDGEDSDLDDSEDSAPDDSQSILPELDSEAKNMLIFIDPGHGGADTGAIGYQNGKMALSEKDVNLDVALRLNALLEDAGASTYMLRQEDMTITLQERPAAANALGADLYVSIHNNSSENPLARGVEVLYYSKDSENEYDISSKDLAVAAQREMLNELGIPDRTIKERPALAVLNKTLMPAIIIEGAFMSNAEDLAIIMTDEFREHYAIAAARAIIQTLNESVEN